MTFAALSAQVGGDSFRCTHSCDSLAANYTVRELSGVWISAGCYLLVQKFIKFGKLVCQYTTEVVNICSPKHVRTCRPEENLPPENGPHDEEEPLIPPETPPPHAGSAICGTAMLLIMFGLLISTVAFASLYYHLLRAVSASEYSGCFLPKPLLLFQPRLPKWPKPSISPLGKYSRAAVAADNEYCSEIGRWVFLRANFALSKTAGEPPRFVLLEISCERLP